MSDQTKPRVFHPGIVHFALAMGGFAIGTTEFATMSLLPFFAPDLGIDAPTAGHVISAYALGAVVGAPVIAVLSARIGRRTLLIGLMAMFALGNALSALAPGYHAMLLFRFLTGLPHGAYFGIGMLMAASLVPAEKRSQAVGRVLLGLTVATIIGVPFANWLCQSIGWRWSFGIVAILAAVTAVLVGLFAPRGRVDAGAGWRREVSALKSAQVWLTLAIGAVGFAGVFAVYTYLASTLIAVTGVSADRVPFALAAFGIGMTAASIVVPRLADRALMPTAGLVLLWGAATLALYPFAALNFWTLLLDVAALGAVGSLSIVLQTRLMDVAGDGQSLAAALNHSAFNFANALGPLAGGMAIAAGYGLTSTGWVGCALTLGGLAIWSVARRRVAAA
jgi:DHA1 family inner membrane transport protein